MLIFYHFKTIFATSDNIWWHFIYSIIWIFFNIKTTLSPQAKTIEYSGSSKKNANVSSSLREKRQLTVSNTLLNHKILGTRKNKPKLLKETKEAITQKILRHRKPISVIITKRKTHILVIFSIKKEIKGILY